MKTPTKILFFLAAAFALTSCLEPDNMLTVVNPDGSCYKEFRSKVGSDFMLGNDLSKQKNVPVLIDSTWKIAWRLEDSTEINTVFPIDKALYDSIYASMPNEMNPKTNKIQKKQPVFEIILRKEFKSVAEMARTFKLRDSHEWSKMKVQYSLEKKFRWFYTYYDYKETYPKIETFFKIPIDSFMNKEEATYWFNGEPNIYKGMNGVEIREAIGDLENKYNRWFNMNLWDIQFDLVLKNYDMMTAAPVSKDSLSRCKHLIFDSKVNSDRDYDMEKILNNYFKTNAFTIYWATDESPLKKFENLFEKQEFIALFTKEFNYKLLLPGRVIPKENVVMDGDTLNFKLTAYRMIYDDYVIQAESRKANVWAFIVSGLIVALAIGSFWYKPKR